MRYFLSLAKMGSVSKAAELHHISPPAFSKAMKILESEVGQTLIVPHGRGIILTDHARRLVPAIEEIVNRIDRIPRLAHIDPLLSVEADTPTLKVATFEVFSTHFFERAVSEAFSAHLCTVFEMIPGQMEDAVASRIVDLAITYIPIPHPELDFVRIQEVQMGIFAAAKASYSCETHALPFVVPISPIAGSPSKVKGLDGWPDDAFPRNIRHRVAMLETALGLCRQGLAVAYIPRFIARLHNETVKSTYQLAELPLPERFPKKKAYAYIIKRKSDQEGALLKKMAVMVRKICHSFDL